MPVQVRAVDALCSDLKMKLPGVKQILADLGVTIIDGYYDHSRYESALNEPSWLRNKRREWSLSHTTGLGAVKHLLDPLKVNIVAHDFRGPNNYITIETANRKRYWCKLCFRNSWAKCTTKEVASFFVRGFNEEFVPEHYLLMCVEGNLAWHFSRDFLRKSWDELRHDPPKYVEGVQCSWSDRHLKQGSLHFWLDFDSPHLLTDVSDFKK